MGDIAADPIYTFTNGTTINDAEPLDIYSHHFGHGFGLRLCPASSIINLARHMLIEEQQEDENS